MPNKITYPLTELTREQIYRHTVARGTSLKNMDDGDKITIKELVCFEDEDGKKIISMLDMENNHYVSNSGIFREELSKIVDIFGDHDITIKVRKEVSKAGRTFVTCELA